MKELFREYFQVWVMLFILLILIICHMGMMGLNRPPDMIQWVEGLITGVFTALVAMLTQRKEK